MAMFHPKLSHVLYEMWLCFFLWGGWGCGARAGRSR